MRPEKVEIFIDGRITVWLPGSEISSLTINENQQVKIKICLGAVGEMFQVLRLDIEDYSIQLHRDDFTDTEGRRVVTFSSSPAKVFRESFGGGGGVFLVF